MNTIKLGTICDIVAGGTPSRSKPEYWQRGTIPWIKIGNIKGKYIKNADEFITNEGLENSSAKMLSKGTILYSIFATLGEVGILDFDACTNQAIAGLTIKEPSLISENYLYYYLKSKKNYINSIGRGAAQNNINLSILRNFDIPLPEIKKQKEIINILDNIASIITLRNLQIQKLDELIKVRFVEMFGNLRNNPKKWPICSFKEITEIITDGEHITPQRSSHGIYLLSARNILDHKIQLNDVDYINQEEYERIAKRIIPQAGDVLITCSGTVGRCCTVPEGLKFQMVRSAALLRFKKTILPVYAEYMISSDDLQEQINSLKTASSQANLFQGKISKLKSFVPSLDLQTKFVKFVSQVNKAKSVIQGATDKTQLLFNSLMQEYFG